MPFWFFMALSSLELAFAGRLETVMAPAGAKLGSNVAFSTALQSVFPNLYFDNHTNILYCRNAVAQALKRPAAAVPLEGDGLCLSPAWNIGGFIPTKCFENRKWGTHQDELK